MVATPELIDAEPHIELRRSHLRGRRPVRADRRLCADEKRIRAQSAILDETHTPHLLFAWQHMPPHTGSGS
jgi:hypothetical protein